MLSYQKSDHVNLHFVIPESCQSEDDVIDEMKMAFQECTEADFSPEWISERKCLTLSYTKLDVFIMQEFSGEVFNKLRSTKSVVCGPVCLRTCLAEGTNIPENNSPVFTTAMRNLSITASNTTPQKKTKIKEKVGFMGGIYTSNLVEVTTHLVSNAVRSAKYEKATEKGIKVMTDKWIDAVWEASLKRNVKATDPEFDKYKCKIFQDLQLTCSNLDRAEKEKIKKLVNENGGLFTPQLHQNTTSLLVISAPHGDKYKFANSWKLPCVYPSWITDSVEKGYAIPTTNHLLSAEMKCSTPTSTDLANFTLGAADQFSLISHDIDKSHVNETALSNASVFTGRNTQSQNQITEGSKYKKILETLNITTAKRAGLFVDGCKVFLSGFTVQEVERLRRLLSLGGATIFNELSETVSYVIVGDHVFNDVKTISNMTRRPYVVSLEWLAASIKQKGPASGDLHSCLVQMNIPVEPPSPLSQKGLKLLQPADGNKQDSFAEKQALMTPQPAVSRKLFKDFAKPAEANKADSLNSGSASNTTNSQNSVSQNSMSQITEIFKGLTFKIEIEGDEQSREMERVIISCGGLVVGSSFKGIPDYAIVPVDCEVRHVSASEIVTYLWVEDCYDNEECVNVEYYHQPFTVHSDKKPLAGYCLGTTIYTGKEKVFLTLLGEALGAIYQDVFARKVNEAKGIFASTHLITPAPSGFKYDAAKKWNIPAVTKDWLLTCARIGTKVAEEPYLVTDENNLVTSVNKNDEEPKQISVNESHETSKERLMGPPNCSKSSVEIPNRPNCSQSAPICTQSILGPPVCTKTSIRTSNCTQSPMGPPDRPQSLATPLRTSIGPIGDAGFSSMVSSNVGNTSGSAHSSRDMPSRVTPCKRKSSCMSEQDSDLSPFHMDTPDTPYGQVFGVTPTRSSKKRWKRFLDNFGTYAKEESPPVKPRRDSTPISELRKQVYEKFFNPEDFEGLHTNSSDGQNMGMTSSRSEDGKENCEPVSISPRQLNRSEADVSLLKMPKIQSPTTVTEAIPSSSIGTTDDRVTQHLEKLGLQLASHTPPETTMKRRQDLNVLQPPGNTPMNPSSSKQIPKPGAIDSQPITIDWEDPIEAAERSKLNKRKILNQIEKPKPRRFVLGSNLDPNLYIHIIRDLGGEVINSSTFDSSTTHIIVDKPLRSEKLLCCLAAGKWILHYNYLLEVERQQKWLPEEDYEFGNPSSGDNIPKYTDGSSELANAAYRWRSKLKNSEGAYSGMKILLKDVSKKDSLERLISAGSGVVVDETNFTEATHCCMNPWSGAMPDFVKELVKNKIPCLRPFFLGEFLYRDPMPRTEDYILPQLKDLYHN